MSISAMLLNMVRIFGIDIPSGLEDAFFKIFQFTNNTAQDALSARTGVPTRVKKASWNIRSLFVLWDDLYTGLSTERKTAWTNYWISLPFSDHSGGNGWPGSGFSAFVYVNAPRKKVGLDLLLDPPASNLILNGNFASGLDDWSYDYTSIVDGEAVFEAGIYDGSDARYIQQQVLGFEVGVIYHVEFDAAIFHSDPPLETEDIALGVFVGRPITNDFGLVPDLGYEPVFSNDGILTHYSLDIECYTEEGPELYFGVCIQEPSALDSGHEIRIDNIVVTPL